MARIVPKLNLNKTPQLVDNNSLVYAKNIRLLQDGTIGPDTSLDEIESRIGRATTTTETVVVTEAYDEVKYYYTILNYAASIAYDKYGTTPVIEGDHFKFNINLSSTHWDDYYHNSNQSNYQEVSSSDIAILSIYDITNHVFSNITARFILHTGLNVLINTENRTCCLGLAVLQTCYDGIDSLSDTEDYPACAFVSVPIGALRRNIVINGKNYIIINPVFKTESRIHHDAVTEEVTTVNYSTVEYISQIVGLNDKIYFFKEATEEEFTNAGLEYPTNYNDKIRIFEYDEVDNTFTLIKCGWKYSGGSNIRGCVSVNNTGEPILTVCESGFEDDTLVPIKHINLVKCTEEDNETIYTQAPNIPISNLKLVGRYIKTIPAGVYQFFIRYKINDDFYTSWFPCSEEIFAGCRKEAYTLQGTIKHNDLHNDSNNSFIFNIEHLFKDYCNNFEQYQLGFIISSDDGIFARSWKHFDMDLTSSDSIYFEYNQDDIEDINIDELLKSNFDLFNVENIAQYKNKLYISNYKETDFNEDLVSLAKNIKVKLKLKELPYSTSYFFNNIPLNESAISGVYDTFGDFNINYTFRDSTYCDINTTDNIIDTSPETQYEVGQESSKHVSKVFILNNGTKYYIHGDASTDANIPIDIVNSNALINMFIDEIRSNIIGINSNGDYIYRVDNSTTISIDNIHIEYITYTHRYSIPYPLETRYTSEIIDSIELKSSILTNTYQYSERKTLLPFTKYDFYVHYIKQNGIVTNGYFITTKEIRNFAKRYKSIGSAPSEIPIEFTNEDVDDLAFITTTNPSQYGHYSSLDVGDHYYSLGDLSVTDNSIIYPVFSNIKCPNGYVACFISIVKYGDNVAQGFNYEYDDNDHIHKIDCLELDTLLYNKYDNIKIKQSNGEVVTEDASYYSSGTTTPLKHLGCSGHIEFALNGIINTKCWIILDSVNKPYNKTLTKLTPYIKLDSSLAIGYDNYTDINSPGYYCEVAKLNREYCDAGYTNGYYVSGNDIYTRVINSNDFTLSEVTGAVSYHSSTINYIFSNFNLNYVSLTNDLVPQIRRYDIQRENNAEEGTVTSSNKQFITTVNSLTASFILELKSMYKDYTRKLFYEYTKNKITDFNNTIRTSSTDGDETYRQIYKFEATDYYNVPTNRGVITNLVSIANTLYVHCEHSLFKFTDNKTIDAKDEQVVLQENDIFNSGISEVFDAKYGYAGLRNREQSLVTYNAYVFYDAVAKIIYAFGGEQQIGNITEPIKKIVDWINPTDVQFVGDELNDRFFVNLRNETGNICLSFNFKAKSFISIHDIDFKFGFHSRRHTYFVHDDIYEGYKIGWSIYKIVDKITIDNVDYFMTYQNCYTKSLLSISNEDMPDPVGYNPVYACIDVITNVEYEKIKVLNFINWICSEIENYGGQLNFTAEEQLNRLYPGDKLRIYTDSTSTNLFELIDGNGKAKLSNEQRNIDANGDIYPHKESWQYPEYNCGIFSMNYFRDIIRNGNIYESDANAPDIFKYKQAGLTGAVNSNKLVNLTERSQRQYLTQENALIYGKYFIMRLIFHNRNFKVENVIFNMNNYGKTK